MSFENLIFQFSFVKRLFHFLHLGEVQCLSEINSNFHSVFNEFINKRDSILKKWHQIDLVLKQMKKKQSVKITMSEIDHHKIVYFPVWGLIVRFWYESLSPSLTSVIELCSNHRKNSVFLAPPKQYITSVYSCYSQLILVSDVCGFELNIKDIIEKKVIEWRCISHLPFVPLNCSNCFNYTGSMITDLMMNTDLKICKKGENSTFRIIKLDKSFQDRFKSYFCEKMYFDVYDNFNNITIAFKMSRWKSEKIMVCFQLKCKNNTDFSDYIWERMQEFVLLEGEDVVLFDQQCVPIFCQEQQRFEILTTTKHQLMNLNDVLDYYKKLEKDFMYRIKMRSIVESILLESNEN